MADHAPDLVQRVRSSFERQAFMQTVGARLVSIEKGRVVIEWPRRDDLTQQHGFLHAGRTLSVCTAEVYAQDAGKESAIGVVQATIVAVRGNAGLVG